VTAARVEPLGDGGALVEGWARTRQPDGIILERQAAWLLELREGLIWRVRVYDGAEKARSAFRTRTA
jgi:ketosteroid isomerase-like protein